MDGEGNWSKREGKEREGELKKKVREVKEIELSALLLKNPPIITFQAGWNTEQTRTLTEQLIF